MRKLKFFDEFDYHDYQAFFEKYNLTHLLAKNMITGERSLNPFMVETLQNIEARYKNFENEAVNRAQIVLSKKIKELLPDSGLKMTFETHIADDYSGENFGQIIVHLVKKTAAEELETTYLKTTFTEEYLQKACETLDWAALVLDENSPFYHKEILKGYKKEVLAEHLLEKIEGLNEDFTSELVKSYELLIAQLSS